MSGRKKVLVVDQTIREGMQYRGLVFSLEERKKLIEYQAALGVDISQVGYAPAHASEQEIILQLNNIFSNQASPIRLASLSRALIKDVRPMLAMGVPEIHMHTSVTSEMLKRASLDVTFSELKKTINYINDSASYIKIDVSVLDIGRTDVEILHRICQYLIHELGIDVISLPDTSGMLAPNQIYEKIASIKELTACQKTKIGVHCHNDLGMASANTLMGVLAGAEVLQVSALGIGERNGIGDLFLVCKMLKDQGVLLNVNVDDEILFKKYYEYVNQLCLDKTGSSILNYTTPYFGQAVKTHVAGTHGIGTFGIAQDEEIFLNVLCGKHLVRKYLDSHKITYHQDMLSILVCQIKDKSVKVKRALTEEEVRSLAAALEAVKK